MKQLTLATALFLAVSFSSDIAAKGKQAPAQRQPDMCVTPAGAQPLLPAKLLPGMGITKDFPVTTTSEEARKFFLQGISQIHSFWFVESERSCTQALQHDPEHGDGVLVHRAQRGQRLPTGVPVAAKRGDRGRGPGKRCRTGRVAGRGGSFDQRRRS